MASSLGRERREEEESMVPELVACSSHLRPPKPPPSLPLKHQSSHKARPHCPVDVLCVSEASQ